MIRPSALQLAESCGLAPALAAQFPESSEAADEGTEDHAQIAAALTTGKEPTSDDARWAVQWVRETFPVSRIMPERRVQLRDPETDELITEGTPDLLVQLVLTETIVVIDWKTGEAANLPHPNDSLQLGAYGAAASLELGMEGYLPIYVRTKHREPIIGKPVTGDALWAMIERVRRAASREPVARKGSHCWTCYARQHCAAWTLPAFEGPTALEPFTKTTELTQETALRGLLAVQALKDVARIAESRLKAFARANGGIRDESGRVWLSTIQNVSAHERAGGTREVFKWRKA